MHLASPIKRPWTHILYNIQLSTLNSPIHIFVYLMVLYNLESKTPVLLSKQGFCMGSYFQRGLTLEQPNDRVLQTLRKKIMSWNIYMLIRLQSSPELWQLPQTRMILMGSYFRRSKYCIRHGVLLSKGSYFKAGSYFRDYTVLAIVMNIW